MRETYHVIFEDTDTRILPEFDEPIGEDDFATFDEAKGAARAYCHKMIKGLRRVLRELNAHSMASYWGKSEAEYSEWRQQLLFNETSPPSSKQA